MMPARPACAVALVAALACAAPLVLAVVDPAFAADERKPTPTTKLKKNQAVLADDWAQRGIRSIAVTPVRMLDGDEQALALTRRALENALADRGFKLLGGASISPRPIAATPPRRSRRRRRPSTPARRSTPSRRRRSTARCTPTRCC